MRSSSITSRPFSHGPRVALATFLAIATVGLSAGADGPEEASLDAVMGRAEAAAKRAEAWYRRTPPEGRVAWGGLAACAVLALGVAGERMIRVRRKRVIPEGFAAKFLERLAEGKLDRGKCLDYCELNPSPASRVVLAAVRRWGRPSGDLERAANLARQLEADRLRRNVGTLRRIAALAPLVGLLGTLLAAGRALANLGNPGAGAWGPAVAGALGPLTAGVALAILALVAYDGLMGRVESLASSLDRVAAETIDAIAMSSPEPRRTLPPGARRGARIDLPEAQRD